MDDKKLNDFLGKFLGDAAASLNGLLVFVGDRLGLYRAMAEAGHPLAPDELASRAGTNPRMTKEWLSAQAANGYLEYDPKSGKFSLPPEHALVLADENSPVFLQGGIETSVSLYKDEEKIINAMKTGKGLGWGDHHPYFYEGEYRLTIPTYRHLLVQSWIPALEGVEAKLSEGASVAEVGSGAGVALCVLAKGFPRSTFIGFDSNPPSVERANSMAKKEGLGNVKFEVADAASYPGGDYDLIAFFSCLHDMGDPQAALAHAFGSLRNKSGTLAVTEAPAGDAIEQNFNPIGQLLYPVSTLECVPASLDQGGLGPGTLMGESRLEQLITSSGFSGFKRVAESPLFNLYEAKAL